MNILSYDYHSAYESNVNHHAPLYALEEESEYNFDSHLTIVSDIQFLSMLFEHTPHLPHTILHISFIIDVGLVIINLIARNIDVTIFVSEACNILVIYCRVPKVAYYFLIYKTISSSAFTCTRAP